MPSKLWKKPKFFWYLFITHDDIISSRHLCRFFFNCLSFDWYCIPTIFLHFFLTLINSFILLYIRSNSSQIFKIKLVFSHPFLFSFPFFFHTTSSSTYSIRMSCLRIWSIHYNFHLFTVTINFLFLLICISISFFGICLFNLSFEFT